MKSIVNRIFLALLAAVALYFWLTPAAERNAIVDWMAGFVFLIVTLALSIRASPFLRRWRGFGVLAACHVAAQLWLQWQWGLWNSPIVLVRNLNVLASLLVLGTLFAMLVSLVLLLVHRDASALALAAAWLGWPALFIATIPQPCVVRWRIATRFARFAARRGVNHI